MSVALGFYNQRRLTENFLMAIKAAEGWITSEDGKLKVQRQAGTLTTRRLASRGVIHVEGKETAQPILGFGGTFNGSATYHFARMSPRARKAALTALFDPVKGAGWNLMRIPFGSTDWDRDWNFYTYDDMPAGERDDALSHFSIREDLKRGHVQVIREAMAINPELKLIAAVWGPPAWMKSNGKLITDGIIPPRNYRVYARYLCKCVQAYESEGLPILSVSPQNEPLCDDGRLTPQALWMEWKPMRDFLVVMAREFTRQRIKSQIWFHDHNFCFFKDYVRPLLKDPHLRQSIDGLAWHDYEGDPAVLDGLVDQYPDLPMYHTERSIYSLEGLARILLLLEKGCRSHNQWTTIADEYGAPHQFAGGSDKTTAPVAEGGLPALMAPRRKPNAWRTTLGHDLFALLTRSVKRGAVRIPTRGESSAPRHAAFRNVDGTTVLVAVNTEKKARKLVVALGKIEASFRLPARSAGAFSFFGRSE